MADATSLNDAPAAPLPGYWRFVWMFFMQPISLHHALCSAGIDEPNIAGRQWWRRRRQLGAAYREYGKRLAALRNR